MKIKVRLNANGVILVASANLVDKKKAEEIAADNGNAAEANNMDAQEVCNNLIGFIRNLQFDLLFIYFFFLFILEYFFCSVCLQFSPFDIQSNRN